MQAGRIYQEDELKYQAGLWQEGVKLGDQENDISNADQNYAANDNDDNDDNLYDIALGKKGLDKTDKILPD